MSLARMIYENLWGLESEIFCTELPRVSRLPSCDLDGILNQRQNVGEILELRDIGDDEVKDSLFFSLALIEE
jgi:hypothetical protein